MIKKFIFNAFIKHRNIEYKRSLIKRGKFLNLFLADSDKKVRMALAQYGRFHDKLILDKSASVRAEVIKHSKHDVFPETIIYDEAWVVREALAKKGLYLKYLMYDASPNVRRAVAYRGYGIATLINDSDAGVRGQAKAYLVFKILPDLRRKPDCDKLFNDILNMVVKRYERYSDNDIISFMYGLDAFEYTGRLNIERLPLSYDPKEYQLDYNPYNKDYELIVGNTSYISSIADKNEKLIKGLL